MRRLACFFLCSLLPVMAARKQPSQAEAANDKLQISATLLLDRESIQQELGSDLDGYFIVLKMQLTPNGTEPLALSLDDFLLRSFKDGQKCAPYAPSQIAGRATLVVNTRTEGGGPMAEDRGPVWGGIPGTGGRPERMSDGVPGMGNAPGQTRAQAKIIRGDKDKPNPLLAVLKEKVLQEGEISKPVSGLLYFSLEGKHKPKDLKLEYRGPAGPLNLQFH
jgi:hypothetical protein